ncbi:restriction endonuclease [Massilia sp. erpn]|nr:restriction endonuclease [Massilia sp. erpn]
MLDRWELTHDEFTIIVDSNPSLRGVTQGYIAEWKFHEMFLNNPDITEAQKDDDHNRKRKGDRRFKYKGHEFIVEVKSLQTNLVKRLPDGTCTGRSQVDASDRRKVEFKDGSTLETTCLLRGEFDVLAVNCYAFNGKWEFAFALNRDLPQNTFRKYNEAQRAALLPSLIPVTWPVQEPFVTNIFTLLDRIVVEREAGVGPEVPEVPVRSVVD